MKQYDFNIKTLERALDTALILQNLKYRMHSIKYIIERKEQLEIDDKYIDIMYQQYLELETELSEHIKVFYNNTYDSFEKYDNKLEELIKQEE